MVITLNQIVEIIKAKALNQSQVNSFFFGDSWEVGSGNKITYSDGSLNPTPLYPLIGLTLIKTEKEGKLKSTTFNMWACDLVHKDIENEQDVLSDMDLIINELHDDIHNYLQYDQNINNATLDSAFVTEPFNEKFDDEVSGHQGEIKIIQSNTKDTCQIPTKTGMPPINSQTVLIKDQDGNIIATLNPGSIYYVTVLQALQDSIDNNQFTIIENLT